MEELLGDFAKVSKAEWEEKIIADLKGKPFEDLLWKAEGVQGGPAYTAEDLEQLLNMEVFQNNSASGNLTLQGARHWVNYQSIVVDDETLANKTALEALNLGANGLYFQLKSIPAFEKLLKNIQLPYCAVAFAIQDDPQQFISAYTDYIKSQGYGAAEVTGFLTCTQSEATPIVAENDFLTFFKSINISTPASLIRANIVQELGLLLHNLTTEIVRQLDGGSSIDSVFKKTQFQLLLGDNYFMEIAKIRALRVLIQSVFEGFNHKVEASDILILSASGNWQEEVEDSYNYLLKGTTQAMSAIIGGCNGLLLFPFDATFKGDSTLAARMARNISSILKDESYLDKVVDPSAGSYFIETMTNQLAQNSWQLFLELEKQSIAEISLEELNELTSKAIRR